VKILFVLPYSPVPTRHGGALRVYHLIRLAARHHDVSIVSFGFPDCQSNLRREFGSQINEIHIVPRHWQRRMWRLGQFYSLFTRHSFFYMLGHHHGMQRKLDEIFEKNEYDLVQTEFALTGTYRLNTGGVKLLDAHNVEYDNFRRMWMNARSPLRKMYYHGEYKKFYREEMEACRESEAMLVTSPVDKQILDKEIPTVAKYVVPNGVDASYFSPSAASPEPRSLVFTGLMSYLTNNDGVGYFLDEIFPRIVGKIPDIKLYVVGDKPPEKLRRRVSANVVVTGYVDDVRPYVNRSSVYVVPLRLGSGTRLKVVEAMAMKKPIVTTSIGCEGIDVVNNESALIADDPGSFADSVVRLLNDQTLRERLVRNGYEVMSGQYEWSVIGDRLEQVYALLRAGRESVTMNPPEPMADDSVKQPVKMSSLNA
jgi:glycosyltransferase involved in cell wall biosynthesis